MQLTIISGTNRHGSATRQLCGYLQKLYANLGAEAALVDLKELPAETFHPGVYASKPASLRPLLDCVLGADGLVVVAPEYNGSYPGVLKFFIDLLPFPEAFEARPSCFIGLSAGQNGNLRGIEQLQHIFGYRNGYVYPRRVFIPGFSDRFDNGDVTDADLAERLHAQAEGFIGFVRRLKG